MTCRCTLLHREPADRHCAITSLDNLVSYLKEKVGQQTLDENSFVTVRSHIFWLVGTKSHAQGSDPGRAGRYVRRKDEREGRQDERAFSGQIPPCGGA
jgi:hypothetical protein